MAIGLGIGYGTYLVGLSFAFGAFISNGPQRIGLRAPGAERHYFARPVWVVVFYLNRHVDRSDFPAQ